MGYTDLWRCKRCQTLPDITFLSGKRFLIECKVCRGKASVEAGSIDAVVKLWNKRNDPQGYQFTGFFQAVKDYFSYRREKREERRAIEQRRKAELLEASAPPPAEPDGDELPPTAK